MINFRTRDADNALLIAKELAEEERIPYKVVKIGGFFYVRKYTSKGVPMAVYGPKPIRGKDGSRTDLQAD